jgi:SprT protein
MTELQTKAIERIRQVYAKAELIYGRSFKFPTVSFKLKGRRAGSAIPAYNKLILNNDMLHRNGDAFVNDTPGHEAAHLIAYDVYGYMIEPHGKEWKKVMLDVCNQQANRCHNFEVVTRHEYICKCENTIYVSTTKHNRIIKGRSRYYCTTCKVEIRWKKLYEKVTVNTPTVSVSQKIIATANY